MKSIRRRKSSRFSPIFLIVILLLIAAAYRTTEDAPQHFYYDAADSSVAVEYLGNTEFYDPGVAVNDGEVWLTWLEFIPGEGDVIWVGKKDGDGWANQQKVIEQPGRFARPTLTFDSKKRLWLSYERYVPKQKQWDVVARMHEGDGKFGPPMTVSENPGNDINHSVAAGKDGALWFAWQGDHEGRFEIFARRLSEEVSAEKMERISHTAHGDWRPSIAVGSSGDVVVAWDYYNGEDFDVLYKRRTPGGWKETIVAAGGPAFQGRAQIAANSKNEFWLLWEEGEKNWGKFYRGNEKVWDNVTDAYGPVHRFRTLKIAKLDAQNRISTPASPLPTPAFQKADQRKNLRQASEKLGAFYERGKLAIDEKDRLWVAYRHFYQPQLGAAEPVIHHIEAGWKIFARRLEKDGWSELISFDAHQRDGLQRLSIAAKNDQLLAAYSAGRTDRRNDAQTRGVVFGEIDRKAGESPAIKLENVKTFALANEKTYVPEHPSFQGRRLFWGDLHRHTDISLCFPFYDGSLDDGYRYGIEAGALDFLAITDHSRDIDKGNVQSQLWWRSLKEVTRHSLHESFFPYFAFERSNNNTDHNVISLNEDILRPHQPPLPEFWAEIDENTFTIPHRTAPTPAEPLNGKIWEYHDEAKRPLLEIFQGFRDMDVEESANTGLEKGYRFGFVASSDHLSTSASYAGVWAEEASKESIFHAMKSRRTFGATDRISLVLRAGDRWMGEKFSAKQFPEFQINVRGTAPIKAVIFKQNGKQIASLPFEAGSKDLALSFTPPSIEAGEHYFYVHTIQADGNQAWSSPIWVQIE